MLCASVPYSRAFVSLAPVPVRRPASRVAFSLSRLAPARSRPRPAPPRRDRAPRSRSRSRAPRFTPRFARWRPRAPPRRRGRAAVERRGRARRARRSARARTSRPCARCATLVRVVAVPVVTGCTTAGAWVARDVLRHLHRRRDHGLGRRLPRPEDEPRVLLRRVPGPRRGQAHGGRGAGAALHENRRRRLRRLHGVAATIIIGREITMSAIREWAAAAGGEAHGAVAVNSYGKWKTATQLVALSILLGVRDGCEWLGLRGAGGGALVQGGVWCLRPRRSRCSASGSTWRASSSTWTEESDQGRGARRDASGASG